MKHPPVSPFPYQIGYRSDLQITGSETQLPVFYLINPKGESYLLGTVKLLQHFRWTWIGLVAPDTSDGVKFTRTMVPLMTNGGICVAFSYNIEANTIFFIKARETAEDIALSLWQKKVNVLVFYRDVCSLFIFSHLKPLIDNNIKSSMGKIWISIDLEIIGKNKCGDGSLFLIHARKRQNFENFDTLSNRVKQFGEKAFECSYSKYVRAAKGWKRCAEKDKIPTEDVIKGVVYGEGHNIYITLQAVAHALHSAYTSRNSRLRMGGGDRLELQRVQSWQLYPFLRNLQFYNLSVEGIENRSSGFDIINCVMLPNNSFGKVTVGSIDEKAPTSIKFFINQDAIVWPSEYNQNQDAIRE
uniref:Uncharacterized protein n=1 Tax=Sphaerodactylus townsendi TaxID=933632 RepID=A0ACB8EFC9_9SAUR